MKEEADMAQSQGGRAYCGGVACFGCLGRQFQPHRRGPSGFYKQHKPEQVCYAASRNKT